MAKEDDYEQLGVAREAGTYQEASVYCGRVLLSIEIEERSEKREPSPAQIAMKPKDCIDLWSARRSLRHFWRALRLGLSRAGRTFLRALLASGVLLSVLHHFESL